MTVLAVVQIVMKSLVGVTACHDRCTVGQSHTKWDFTDKVKNKHLWQEVIIHRILSRWEGCIGQGQRYWNHSTDASHQQQATIMGRGGSWRPKYRGVGSLQMCCSPLCVMTIPTWTDHAPSSFTSYVRDETSAWLPCRKKLHNHIQSVLQVATAWILLHISMKVDNQGESRITSGAVQFFQPLLFHKLSYEIDTVGAMFPCWFFSWDHSDSQDEVQHTPCISIGLVLPPTIHLPPSPPILFFTKQL